MHCGFRYLGKGRVVGEDGRVERVGVAVNLWNGVEGGMEWVWLVK